EWAGVDRVRGLRPGLTDRMNSIAQQILRDPRKLDRDVVAAFVLGAWTVSKIESNPQIEGRERGLENARRARLRQGELNRRAVIGAARKLYSEDDSLRRNDKRTAELIREQKIISIGHEAIMKHLRSARADLKKF